MSYKKQQSIRWFCDSFDSSGIDSRQSIITNIEHDHRPQASQQKYSDNENQDKILLRLHLVDYNNRPAVPL